MIALDQITGLVLAGGRATRMGGLDKGLQGFRGQPLVWHALQRLRQGGIDQLLISANRHLSDYAAFGAPVCPDQQADYAGPLAGMLAGLAQCRTPYMLCVPCDAPLLPLDLPRRLAQALQASQAALAVAAAPETGPDGTRVLRRQPVFCLIPVALLESLRHYTLQGGRQVGAWIAQQGAAVAAFDHPGDDPLAFFNANTLAELQQLENKTA